MLNKTITATTELLQHYCDRDGYIILMVQNPTSNSYFTIGDLTITRGGTAGKKYTSDSSIDWRSKFQGIEKKGGRKGQRTYGIEQGLIEMQGKADGTAYLGGNGEITDTKTPVKIGEILGGHLKLKDRGGGGGQMITVNKTISGNATGEWTAPSNGLLVYRLSYYNGGGKATGYINGIELTELGLRVSDGNQFGIVSVSAGAVQIKTTSYSSYNGLLTIAYFIPL